MFNKERIEKAIVNLNGHTKSFVSDQFSMHNLFSYLLQQAGPSVVKISTFSLSDTAIRNFIIERENGLIKQIQCVLDFSLSKRNIENLLFAGNVVDNIRLCDNHSKMMFILGEKKQFAVVGSANFNENRKTESAVIFFDDPIVNQLEQQFDFLFNISMPL